MSNCLDCNISLLHYNMDGYYCPKCFSVYAKETPSDAILQNYYSKFNQHYHGGGRRKGASKRQQLYAMKYLKIVSQYLERGTLLDIGSSTNPFPNIALEKGFNVSIADYSKPSNLDPEVEYIESPVEKIIDIGKTFDIVTAFAILEHTRDPLLAIKNIVNLTNQEGYIVIYIPEIGRFPDKYSLGLSNWFCPPEHLNLLSKDALVNIFNKHNCKLIKYSRFEISLFRYIVRYGIGFIEGTIGYFIKKTFSKFWLKIRTKRKSKYQGMSMFIFKKENA